MNGDALLVDTNVFINLGNGYSGLDEILQDKKIFISVITEIEVLGYSKITDTDTKFFSEIFGACNIVHVSEPVKIKTIELKRKYKLKTPDAIIAATAIVLDKPLLTFDKAFSKIDELNIFLL